MNQLRIKKKLPLLSHFASSQYTEKKNSAEFTKDLRYISKANDFMCSLDVETLYTSIPVSEAIDITSHLLCANTDFYRNFNRLQY